MAKAQNRPARSVLWGCLLLITMVGLLTVFFPGLVLGSIMIVLSRIPDMRSESDFVWEAIGTKGPGFENLEILEREGKYGPQPGLTVSFRISMDTAEGFLNCSGKMQAFQSDPNYIGITWDSETCKDTSGSIGLAHYTLENADASRWYTNHDMESVLGLLCHWVRESKIRVESIRSWDVRYLVEDRLTEGQ